MFPLITKDVVLACARSAGVAVDEFKKEQPEALRLLTASGGLDDHTQGAMVAGAAAIYEMVKRVVDLSRSVPLLPRISREVINEYGKEVEGGDPENGGKLIDDFVREQPMFSQSLKQEADIGKATHVLVGVALFYELLKRQMRLGP